MRIWKESKTKWKINRFILGVLFKDRKETLASLVKILNDNFGERKKLAKRL